MKNLIQKHLIQAKQRMKTQADKKRSKRQFSVGDMVFLKLQPYVQSSLAPSANMKLALNSLDLTKSLRKSGLLHISWSCHPILSSTRSSMFHNSRKLILQRYHQLLLLYLLILIYPMYLSLSCRLILLLMIPSQFSKC